MPPFGHNESADGGLMWNTWDWMAYKHTYVSMHHIEVSNGALFLPWHRKWLMYYEDEFRRILSDENVTVPYWDFTNEKEYSKVFTDVLFGGNGTNSINGSVTNGPFGTWDQKVNTWLDLQPGHLSRYTGISWTVAHHRGEWKSSFGNNISRRTVGLTPEQKQAGTMPTSCDVLEVLSTDQFYNGDDPCYPTLLQGLWYTHRMVHRTVGGDMNYVAANDPLLIVIHCMVDKIWTMWQKGRKNDTTHNMYGYPNGALNQTLLWVGGTPREMIDWEAMPYQYEWDDTLDEKYYRFYEKGEKTGLHATGMCEGWEKQTFIRNYTDCHLSS